MNLLPGCGATDDEGISPLSLSFLLFFIFLALLIVALIPMVLKTCGASSHAHDLFGNQMVPSSLFLPFKINVSLPFFPPELHR